MLNRGQDFNPKLVCFLKYTSLTGLHRFDDGFPFLYDLRDPPVEGWLFVNLLCYRLLRHLNWVRVVKQRQLLPGL